MPTPLPVADIISVIQEAAVFAVAERAAGLLVEAKARQDFVTQADQGVERLLRAKLTALVPGSEFLGEEDGGATEADVLWVVDPIDGTTNYIRGLPHWCISAGLVENGVPRFGVILAPTLDWLYLAEAGKGATRNGVALKRSHVEPTEALIDLGQSPRQPMEMTNKLRTGLREHGVQSRILGSGALGLAMSGSGEVDGFIEGHIWSWDVMAGMLIAREAGCIIRDFLVGDAMTKGNAAIVAAPGLADILFAATEHAMGASLPRLPAATVSS
jgi:myo-inositol-1(or 4)-monophosphatase